MKEHEKFIAFCLLGGALVAVAFMAYFKPIPDIQTGSAQIINTIVGALTLAFGGAANALFRISDTVSVNNPPEAPVNVTEPTAAPTTDEAPVDAEPSNEELPSYAR